MALLALMFCSLLARKVSDASSAESEPWSSVEAGRAAAASPSSNFTCLSSFVLLRCPVLFTPFLCVVLSSASESSSLVDCWVEGAERRATLSRKGLTVEVADALDVVSSSLGKMSG